MLKWLAIGAIAVTVGVGAPAYAAREGTKNKPDPKSDSHHDNDDSQKTPSVVVQVGSQPSNAFDTEEKKEADRDLADYTRWLAIFTAVLAAVSIGQGYFLRRQAHHLQTHAGHLDSLAAAAGASSKATTEISTAIQRQAELTGKTLSAIERQADLMENSLVVVQRAFVFFRNVESHAHMVDAATNQTSEWHFGINWGNSGTTPTRGLDLHVNWLAASIPLPSGYNFPGSHQIDTPYVLGPKASAWCGPLIITTDILLGIQQGTHHLYFWGTATYRDVFERTTEHRTKFCWKMTGVWGDPRTNDVRFQFAAHNEHNCADEDCS
jgi:hypothetical protein